MMSSILSPPDANFAQWLYAETQGQPFYLIETLKDLLERRVLHPKRRVEGQWTFSVDADHNLGEAVRVPSTVHAVIRSRLNRLSPSAFSLLAGAAVLEHRITFEHMCAISNLSEDQALPALDELIQWPALTGNSAAGCDQRLHYSPTTCCVMWCIPKLGMRGGGFFTDGHWKSSKKVASRRRYWPTMR